MDKVKAALTDFTHRSGHHDTTVHEAVAPAVTHEVIKPHQHEEINTAVDKEVHQDHYHRTVQPVKDREVLPETHTAKLGAVQHREFDHRDHDHVKRSLAQEQAQFRDERRVESATASQSVAPTIGGEHVHHHIHETIQPVIEKEVIQPNVVHTTVPIHEVHHNKATVHETTALPTMTIDEFKHKGGVLSGREERYDEFEGVPKNIGGGTAGGFGHIRDGHSSHTGHSTTAGPHDSNLANRADPRVDSDRSGAGYGTGNTGRHVGTDGAIGSNTTGTDLPKALTEDKSRANHLDSGHHSSSTGKPSLMDKLNPKKDTDGDGKRGIME
jgi:hypothetical protein